MTSATPLGSVADLATALDGPAPPIVLDVRWRLGGPPGREAYAAGHLPGAAFLDLDRDLAGEPGAGGRHPLPDPRRLEAALRAAGVSAGRPVVAYDDGDLLAAARAWWVLRWAGHRDVRVLDGGFPAWLAAGRPVTTDVPSLEPGDITVTPGGMPVLDAAGAARVAADGVLLDARVPERFRGEAEPIDPVAGRIPGAVNLPAAALLEGGRLARPETLRARFAAAGADGSRPVGAYCGSGVTAALPVLAAEVAGVPAALYVGSWSEWITDPSRPVARGAPPP